MIRFAKAEDKNLWVKLNIDFMKFEIANSDFWNNVDESKHEELAKTFDEAIKNHENITIFMIEHQGEIIGFANLMTIFSIWAQGRALIIDDLYIRSEYQGKGFGSQVMRSWKITHAKKNIKGFNSSLRKLIREQKLFIKSLVMNQRE